MHPFIRILSVCAALAAASWAIPAFPGAEGWGAVTPGGRGPDPKKQPPKVYVVTTLAASGKGSFNEAFQAKGPRIIVFRVSGHLSLQDIGFQNDFIPDSSTGYVTVAGQTSPGGITFTNSGAGSAVIYAYHRNFHDFVFRFLRFRATGENNDCMTLNTANHFILDHCDLAGGSDETLDITASNDFTVQWTTITNSSVCSDCQTYGFLMGYPPTSHISLHHNLMAHHVHRFPAMHWDKTAAPDFGQIDYRNNVLYNGGEYFMLSGNIDPPATVRMNIVGNTFKGGPQSPPNAGNVASWFFSMVSLGDEITGYENDNVMIPRSGQGSASTIRVRERTPNRVETAWNMPAVTTQAREAAYELVLDKVGAVPRDAMITRTVSEVRNGTGQFGKTDDAMLTSAPTPPEDADLDGMADAWEVAMGLDPKTPGDNVQDQDDDGYLNIEEYINDVAALRLGEAPANNKGAQAIRDAFSTRLEKSPGQSPRRLRTRIDRGSGKVEIRLPADRKAEGRLEIADSRGRLVASLPAQALTLWDYRTTRALPPGAYTVNWRVDGYVRQTAPVDVY